MTILNKKSATLAMVITNGNLFHRKNSQSHWFDLLFPKIIFKQTPIFHRKLYFVGNFVFLKIGKQIFYAL
jgi:hypothetical protein